MDKQKILQAGKISKEVKEFARLIIREDVLLKDIADKIESKIFELGGKPAFPVNLSINEIAAHYTPSYDDETLAKGLLKVDIGVHVDGWAADTAFSIDLENDEENKKLIESSKNALKNAIKLVKEKKYKTNLKDIGKTIQDTIESLGFISISNLSGHEINEYDLHAGLIVPNFDNGNVNFIGKGIYAIEPFATLSNGSGKVRDGKPSGIYVVRDMKNIRSPLAREVLKLIKEEYKTFPFCSRWIVEKIGSKALIGLRQLEEAGILHHFDQLIESSGKKVSQAENTILISDDEIIVTSE